MMQSVGAAGEAYWQVLLALETAGWCCHASLVWLLSGRLLQYKSTIQDMLSESCTVEWGSSSAGHLFKPTLSPGALSTMCS